MVAELQKQADDSFEEDDMLSGSKMDHTSCSLLIPAPYVERKQAASRTSRLTGIVSKPMVLKKLIFGDVFVKNEAHGYRLCVSLSQNGRHVYAYDASPLGHTQTRIAMHLPDVRVEAGGLQLEVQLTIRCNDSNGCCDCSYTGTCTPPDTHELSDSYVTITFPPVDGNLLTGIEYSPVL